MVLAISSVTGFGRTTNSIAAVPALRAGIQWFLSTGQNPQPTKLTLTVNGRTATDETSNHSVSHVVGPQLTVGTPLIVKAVADAPMPKGWLLHIIRTKERDPKTGGWLEICHSVTWTCSARRPDMLAAGEEAVYAQVTAPTYSALNAQVTVTWKLKLTLTVNGARATDETSNSRHKYATLTLSVGTPLMVKAVTDSPRLPRGWLLHIVRTGERDPKTGGWLEICRTRAPTCRATRPGLTAAAQEIVYAQVTAPTYSVLSAQFTVAWK
jgi:hypothetical protein